MGQEVYVIGRFGGSVIGFCLCILYFMFLVLERVLFMCFVVSLERIFVCFCVFVLLRVS